MQQRALGRTGLRVSRLALGTMTWGRDTDEHEARDILTTYVSAGGNLIDTADSYGGGASERLLGALLPEVVDRDDVCIATAAGIRPGTARHVDASRGHLMRALDTSLRRLGTDYIDLWQVHAWDQATPLDETLAALDDAVRSGRVRYAGVSNYAGWQLAKAATWQQAAQGRAPVASIASEYSLLSRGVEREVVPAALDCGAGILAWSPLGRGVLTGKYRHGVPADSRAASARFGAFVGQYLDEEHRPVVEAVCIAADGLGATPPEVALAWVRDRPGVSSVVVGARTVGQLLAILGSEETVLPDEIAAALDDASSALGDGVAWTDDDSSPDTEVPRETWPQHRFDDR